MPGENRRKAAILDYMDYATVHGVGRSKNTPFIVLKLFWVLALLASLGMIIWQVYDLYLKFQSSPISTSIEVKSAKKLKFPPITICNTNPARYSLIEPESTLDEVIQAAGKKYSIDLSVYNSSDIYSYNYSSSDQQSGNAGTLENDIMWVTAEQFRMKMATLDDFTLENISQPFNEFFLLCNFAGKACDTDAIQTIRTYAYGLCYTFEPYLVTDLTNGEVADAGPKYALELLLNTDQSQSIPFVTSSSGVVIESDEVSAYFHENHGVFVPTGFETNIAMSLVSTERVPGKGNTPRCTHSQPKESILDCHKKCKLEDIGEECFCSLYFFDESYINSSVSLNNTFDPDTGLSPCYTDEHYECIQALEASYVKQPNPNCDNCLPPCSENYYERDVSQTTWPGENFLPILRKILKSQLNDYVDTSLIDREYVRGNLALVRIYLSSLSYQVIKEEYAYSEVDFISDIGGQLGLWAGFSVLSICEVFELVILLLTSGMRRQKTDPVSDVTPIEKS